MRATFRILIAAIIFVPVIAMAQAKKDAPKDAPKDSKQSAPAALPATPERTTASFGDWVMRCEVTPANAKRLCEAAQIITLQGQTSPVAQAAIGQLSPNAGRQITLVLPTNIAIGTKPQAAIGKDGAAPIDLTWQRCAPGACFATAPLSDEAVATFSAQTEPGRITFKDAADHDVVLPLSFRGLSQALAALAKET